VANLEALSEFITIADGLDEHVEAIEGALRMGRRVPDSGTLVPHSWEVRVAQVLELVDGVVGGRPAEPDHTDPDG
jgi:hypothetical protein